MVEPLGPVAAEDKDSPPGWGASRFLWGVGIESSSIPHLGVDQFDWTQHNQMWRDDLRLVRDMGVTQVRYAVPWHYLEPARGRFEWDRADERIAFCRELGIEPMMDVLHFGMPLWLPLAAGDPELPEALERFAGEMARRYRGAVRFWCPVNEPLVMSLFSGDFGFWPPHSRRWRGYFPVLTRVAMALNRATRAIRREQPDAIILISDAADSFQSRDPSLESEVRLRNLRRFLMLDLMFGRVDSHHPLREWITAYGMSELDLEWFSRNPQRPDMIGLDYYCHSDWSLEQSPSGIRQRQAESPAGLFGVANDYYARFGLPMIVTETSIDGKPINRQIWLERTVGDCKRLRETGVPMLGLIWWPLFDHVDWDGAMTHRIGKLHQVGLYKLVRQSDGVLQRVRTTLVDKFAGHAAGGARSVGLLERVAEPQPSARDQLPPLRVLPHNTALSVAAPTLAETVSETAPSALVVDVAPAAGLPGEGADVPVVVGVARAPTAEGDAAAGAADPAVGVAPPAERAAVIESGGAPYGIVAFSHLRWGFVWQRPQQFLSRMAVKHPVLFVEEPFFDLTESAEPRVDLHSVMANVVVAAPHLPRSWTERQDLAAVLQTLTRSALQRANAGGAFTRPLLWYYNPMDALWTLGQFEQRGIVYDCMDELSKFTGAPAQLVESERWLMQHADIVFTGGANLWESKRKHHDNAHFFGCGVEAEHFGLAMDPSTPVPPDIDFMARPIIGWFGVVDERVDTHLVSAAAQARPDWSFAMIGPVVKVDPNLLPFQPNLFWLGGRDYSVLPNYCKAFSVCMMCFAMNSATEYINPTKALEYFATGRPVIATPIPDVVRQYADLIDLVRTPDEFVSAIERAIRAPDPARIERGLERARGATWEATVEKMQVLIDQAIQPARRPSSQPVVPPPAVSLAYWPPGHVPGS